MTIAPSITATLPNLETQSDDQRTRVDDEKMREAAKKFEASFISQMLKQGGLAKALVSTGGEGADAFTGFYIDQLANRVAEQGGFGLADNIYEQLKKYESGE